MMIENQSFLYFKENKNELESLNSVKVESLDSVKEK